MWDGDVLYHHYGPKQNESCSRANESLWISVHEKKDPGTFSALLPLSVQ